MDAQKPIPLSPKDAAKPCIVVSGVNLREMGPLAVFQDALQSLAQRHSHEYEIVALVHRKSLFSAEGIRYLEFPHVASSWGKRLIFEQFTSLDLSRALRPKLWLAMHDITPNVEAEVQAVYCHNPSPFYRPRGFEWRADPGFGLFCAFYRHLYGLRIRKNRHVIVQQEWMRKRFQSMFGIQNVVVAHPSVQAPTSTTSAQPVPGLPFRFFYPVAPRTFKNLEVCLEAARELERRGDTKFELWLTVAESGNRYAAELAREYRDVSSVRWLGPLARERVFALYDECDCLLFASRLETWGMPITEFRGSGKPMLLADLPYAHETAAGYPLVHFFDADDAAGLADLMQRAAKREAIFSPAPEFTPAAPFAKDWDELWQILLP